MIFASGFYEPHRRSLRGLKTMNIFDRIKEDWHLKLLALLMAVVLWFYVARIADNKNNRGSRLKAQNDIIKYKNIIKENRIQE